MKCTEPIKCADLSRRVVSTSDCNVEEPGSNQTAGGCVYRDSCCAPLLQCLGRLSLPPSWHGKMVGGEKSGVNFRDEGKRH